VLLLLFETGSHCIAQTDLELTILLPQPPECWGHRFVPTTASWYFVFNGKNVLLLKLENKDFNIQLGQKKKKLSDTKKIYC
jgi:hypothetical protein